MSSILLVDDDPLIRAVLTRGLLQAGFTVHGAANGQQAWEFLQATRVAVVVSDVQMPIMTGTKLLSKMREELPALPIILMSGSSDSQAVADALRQGAFEFLRKPMTCDDLIAAAHRALARSLLPAPGVPTPHEARLCP